MELALELIQRAKDECWTHLDLGRCGLTELPDQLFELTWLKSLQLCDEYYWFDIDTNETNLINSENSGAANNLTTLPYELASLVSLERLFIGGSDGLKWNLADWAVLMRCSSLISLLINHTNINQLTGIEALGNLQHLDIAANRVESLGNIIILPCLKLLDCGNNPLVTVMELAKLTSLSHLLVYNLGLEKTDVFGQLKQLVFLRLRSNKLNDISSLGALKQLETLDLSNNKRDCN